jgi:hypothetical protein
MTPNTRSRKRSRKGAKLLGRSETKISPKVFLTNSDGEDGTARLNFMPVTTHHIHNVLRTYSKQLSEGRSLPNHGGDMGRPDPPDHVMISVQARRKAIVEKVTSDIVHKIIHDGALARRAERILRPLGNRPEKKPEDGNNDSRLVFKVIDKDKSVVKKTMTIEDSKFLKDELEEISKSKSR